MCGVAQVKMGIEIENADTWARLVLAQVFGQPEEAGIGNFMAAAQAQGQVALVEQLADLFGVSLLRTFQVAADTFDVTAVVEPTLAAPGQVGQCLAQR
ncbi:hypothetical protein D3C72_1212080 [compost metagenome]